MPRPSRLAWEDAAVMLGAPPRPAGLAWKEADGGAFFAARCARARTDVVRRAAWIALAVALGAWALAGDPATAGRLVGLALIGLGASILYVSFADALTHVVVRLDARALAVRCAPRFRDGASIDTASVETFIAGAEGARPVVEAEGTHARVARVERLPLRTFADAAFVAARLTDALARIRARDAEAREANVEEGPGQR